MVRRQHDHRVLEEAAGLERRDDLAHALVDVGEGRVVPVPRSTNVVCSELHRVHRRRLPEAPRMRIERRVGRPWGDGKVDLVVVVEIPVPLSRHVRVVRMAERDAQQERRLAVVARVVVHAADRVKRDLVVVLQGVRDIGHAGLRDRARVVEPPVDPVVRLAPVRRPAEVTGIDVGRQPLLEAVQLIRADEVHLPAQARSVALEPEVVRERRNRRPELGCVVVHGRAGRKRPRHERRPGGSAQRARAVRVLEHDAPIRQAVERRRLRDGMTVRSQERGGELVDHHDEDVRPVGHRPSDAISVNLDR